MIQVIILLVLLACLGSSSASGVEDWEWSAALCVEDSASTYNWNFAKVNDDYAARTMKMVILSMSEEGQAGVAAKESDAENIFDGTTGSTVIATTNTTLGAGNFLYVLTMENGNWMSVFNMDLAEGEYAIFLEHDPDEFHFEDMDSYFTNSDGDEASFDWTSSDTTTDSDSERWDLAYGACALVWVTTFAMICFYYGIKYFEVASTLFTLKLDNLQMFAAGMLLASAFGLIMFESARTLTEGTGVASLWSACAILGFLCSSTLEMVSKVLMGDNEYSEPEEAMDLKAVELTEDQGKGDYKAASGGELVDVGALEAGGDNKKEKDNSLLTVGLLSINEMLAVESSRKTFMSIMIGDFIHNYADGIVIGSAFSDCTTALGWSIATVTILHELPQELADAAILVDLLRLGHVWAALSNLICGAGVMLGAATINAADVNAETKSYFLAFGAGNFIYLACVEFFGKVINTTNVKNDVTVATRFEQMVCFLVGAVIILLIVMDHAHCEATDDDSGDDAHNH